MKTKRRYWTAEEHRLYLETLLLHLPAVVKAAACVLGRIILLLLVVLGWRAGAKSWEPVLNFVLERLNG